ncbi:unconventional myosin-Va-like [Schistocerca serialis cubense]|uniref:unconventional myosin-Va-like n=1 Tax=Schistocerca serialis cubense TaxID=2023355 RepID=UPI00214EC267|nr:unconventional myosin-Va-like [Schistocerca serialis cubense]
MTKLQLSFNDCCSNQTLDDGPGREELLKHYNQLQLEVVRWREECIQLHSILAKQTEGLKNVASINYESHVHLKNEVVELVLAFEAQKVNRQLEDELHQEKNKWQAEREQLQQENEQLREENDNQHKLLSPSLTKSPQTQTEAFMQHEIIRVTSEKLVLQEKLDLAKEELSKCQNSIKLQTEVLKDAGSTIYTIEKVTKKDHDDIDIMVLWLSNTVRLLHNLKQYSGDKTFQTENTSLQNEQCLQNFDLTEYREVLSDTAVEIYQSLAWHIQEKIEPLVVPAILEHEEISGLTSQIPSGKRGRAVLSSWDSEPFLGVQKSLDALLQELNYIYKIMGNHGVDPELTVQIFRQCTDVPTTLQPIIQAAHLLQARKLDEDVQHVCNMCDKLSMLQVRENNALRMAQIELLKVKRKFDALRVVETAKKVMVALLQRKVEDLKTLKSLLENERKEKMTIINEKEHFEKEKAEEVERINKENLRLKAELDKLNERIKSNQFGAAVENLQACVELKRLMLSKDRDGYQKLLEEHNLLEKQNESLKNEMGHLQWHGHSKSTHQCSFYSPITVSAQDKTISGVSDHGEDTEGVLRLHQKVKELEKETIKLQKQMEEVEKEKDSPCGDTAFTRVGFRV